MRGKHLRDDRHHQHQEDDEAPNGTQRLMPDEPPKVAAVLVEPGNLGPKVILVEWQAFAA
jgi:hypothetical protein